MTHSIHVGPPATSRIRSAVLGWDIRRVNTKAVLDPAEARERPIEVAWLLADAIATA